MRNTMFRLVLVSLSALTGCTRPSESAKTSSSEATTPKTQQSAQTDTVKSPREANEKFEPNRGSEADSTPSGTAAETLEFAGQTWSYTGPAEPSAQPGNQWDRVKQFTADDSDQRLLEMLAEPDESESDESPASVTRSIMIQSRRKGHQWVPDGKSAVWNSNGARAEAHYVDGLLHGVEREWHPNGKLKRQREWQAGELHGRSQAWYANGSRKHDMLFENGNEVSGQTWSEDGTPN